MLWWVMWMIHVLLLAFCTMYCTGHMIILVSFLSGVLQSKKENTFNPNKGLNNSPLKCVCNKVRFIPMAVGHEITCHTSLRMTFVYTVACFSELLSKLTFPNDCAKFQTETSWVSCENRGLISQQQATEQKLIFSFSNENEGLSQILLCWRTRWVPQY